MDKNRNKTGGRQKGTPNKETAAKRQETEDFFKGVLPDEIEAKFWQYFITGYVVDPATGNVLPIPVNPTTYRAFERAVEYKRGMPVQVTEHHGNKDEPVVVRLEHIGANPDFFAAQARALGLAR